MKALKFGIIVMACACLVSVVFSGCYSYDNSAISYVYYSEEGYTIGGNITSDALITEAEISWKVGDVIINVGDTFAGEESGTELKEDQKMRWKVENGKLTVHFWRHSYVDIISHEEKVLTLTLPKNIKLNVTSVVSDVVIKQDIDVEEINCETTSGSVKCKGIISKEDVTLKTTSGAVIAGDINAANVTLKSTSGKVETGNVTAEKFAAKSTSGKVVAKQLSARSIKMTSTSGGIRCDKIDGKDVVLSNTSGEIKVDEIISSSNVEIESVSGDIEVGLNDCKETTIDTSSGQINIKLIGGYTLKLGTGSGKFESELTCTQSGGRYVFGDGANEVSVTTSSGDVIIA